MQLRAIAPKPITAMPVVPAVLVALIGAAWLSLLALERSPYSEFAGHAAMHGSAVTRESGQESLLPMLAPFAAGSVLMVIAMMLPVALPLVMRFWSSMPRTGNSTGMLLLLPGGYVLAWTAFGVGAHLALQAGLWAVGSGPGARLLAGPAALVLAGAYQFSPLKRRALHASSPPEHATVLAGHRRRWTRLFALGVREGIACIGCCWALMLLMPVGVAGGSGGMMVLGFIMYCEKNAPWGRRLIMPLGLFLIALGLMLGWGSLLGVLTWHNHSS